MSEHALAGKTIVITRPVDQAQKLANLIQAAGGKSVLFPLIAISPLEDYSQFELQLLALNSADWAIFISSNAVQNAVPRILNSCGSFPQQVQCAAIGPVTAQELKNFGIAEVLTPQGRFDSESLLALTEMQEMAGKNVVIFRGVGGREVLAETLMARGAEVTFAECYQRINPQDNANTLISLWQNNQLDAIVITSSEAMRHLLEISEQGQAEWIKTTRICVNHARIAEHAIQAGLKAFVAAAPGDEAMKNCLIEAFNE